MPTTFSARSHGQHGADVDNVHVTYRIQDLTATGECAGQRGRWTPPTGKRLPQDVIGPGDQTMILAMDADEIATQWWS